MPQMYFPHVSPDDYVITYDAYFSKTVYEAKGRRSKKREAGLLESLQKEIDIISAEHHAIVFWDKPLA